VRRDGSGSLVLLADGRYAACSPQLLALGGRRRLADWVAHRIGGPGADALERAWLEELAGALAAPRPAR
jgi:cell volume regulation protein A